MQSNKKKKEKKKKAPRQAVGQTIQLLDNQRSVKSLLLFDGGYQYTLGSDTAIQILSKSTLVVPEEGTGARLGIVIQDSGSLQHIAIELTYQFDAQSGTNNFYFYQPGKKGSRAAGITKATHDQLSLTFNKGAADGIVVVGTIDTSTSD